MSCTYELICAEVNLLPRLIQVRPHQLLTHLHLVSPEFLLRTGLILDTELPQSPGGLPPGGEAPGLSIFLHRILRAESVGCVVDRTPADMSHQTVAAVCFPPAETKKRVPSQGTVQTVRPSVQVIAVNMFVQC